MQIGLTDISFKLTPTSVILLDLTRGVAFGAGMSTLSENMVSSQLLGQYRVTLFLFSLSIISQSVSSAKPFSFISKLSNNMFCFIGSIVIISILTLAVADIYICIFLGGAVYVYVEINRRFSQLHHILTDRKIKHILVMVQLAFVLKRSHGCMSLRYETHLRSDIVVMW